MPFQIRFDQHSSTAIVVAKGELNSDLVFGAFEEIDQGWGAEASNILWDFRGVSFHSFTLEQIMRIIERKIEQSWRRQSVKSGTLVSGISDKHLMKIFSELSEDTKPHLKIFDEPEQAVVYFELTIDLE